MSYKQIKVIRRGRGRLEKIAVKIGKQKINQNKTMVMTVEREARGPDPKTVEIKEFVFRQEKSFKYLMTVMSN